MSDEKKYDSEEVIQKLFIDYDKTDFIVVKAHLFVEHALNLFISYKNESKFNFDKMSFTFIQKVNISKLMGLVNNLQVELDYILGLNTLRTKSPIVTFVIKACLIN